MCQIRRLPDPLRFFLLLLYAKPNEKPLTTKSAAATVPRSDIRSSSSRLSNWLRSSPALVLAAQYRQLSLIARLLFQSPIDLAKGIWQTISFRVAPWKAATECVRPVRRSREVPSGIFQWSSRIDQEYTLHLGTWRCVLRRAGLPTNVIRASRSYTWL